MSMTLDSDKIESEEDMFTSGFACKRTASLTPCAMLPMFQAQNVFFFHSDPVGQGASVVLT